MQNEKTPHQRPTDFEILEKRLGRIESLLEQVLTKLDAKDAPEIPVLTFIEGPRKGEPIDLSDYTEFRIGRAHDRNPAKLDLAFDDATITSEHCLIRRNDAGDWLIEDLGSTNGTFINGERLKDARTLNAGDCISVGQVKLRFDRVQEISSGLPSTVVRGEM